MLTCGRKSLTAKKGQCRLQSAATLTGWQMLLVDSNTSRADTCAVLVSGVRFLHLNVVVAYGVA